MKLQEKIRNKYLSLASGSGGGEDDAPAVTSSLSKSLLKDWDGPEIATNLRLPLHASDTKIFTGLYQMVALQRRKMGLQYLCTSYFIPVLLEKQRADLLQVQYFALTVPMLTTPQSRVLPIVAWNQLGVSVIYFIF